MLFVAACRYGPFGTLLLKLPQLQLLLSQHFYWDTDEIATDPDFSNGTNREFTNSQNKAFKNEPSVKKQDDTSFKSDYETMNCKIKKIK